MRVTAKNGADVFFQIQGCVEIAKAAAFSDVECFPDRFVDVELVFDQIVFLQECQ